MLDFHRYPDLASERLGACALLANDEFFAPKENLLRADEPIFIEHKYTERGKWMDGWETRRRRTPGHDWCIVKLGARGRIHGVNVRTSFFRGNYPESASIEACDVGGDVPAERLAQSAAWSMIVPQAPLKGDADNLFAVENSASFTHVRLNIFPDGGVARLRVHGRATPDLKQLIATGEAIDLVASQHGGLVLACSDEFFSKPLNMIQPGRSVNMGDGWETKRRRGLTWGPDGIARGGHDWCVLALGCRGDITRIIVDTAHFKGNYPDRCSVEITDVSNIGGAADEHALSPDVKWRQIISETKLQADHAHEFAIAAGATATHVRLNIFPDGGIARFRVFGTVALAAASPRL